VRVTKAWKNTGVELETLGACAIDSTAFAPTQPSRPANDAAAQSGGWPQVDVQELPPPPVRDSGIRRTAPAALGLFNLDGLATYAEPEAKPLRVGEIVGGRYLLEELLGEGGMGQVWAAFDEILQRPVAVKFASEPELGARLEREARIAASLTTPHVAAIFDCGFHDAWTYLVMEKLVGEDLATRLDAMGTLDPETCAALAHDVGHVLDALHAEGAVHRDISPGNLFYKQTPEGEKLVLIDFGIAQSRTASGPKLTQPGFAVGCPDFIAPEQILGAQNLDGRTDLFSFAAVLFAAIVGSLPFEDVTSPLERSYKSAPTARKRLLAVNPRLDPFFAKALALEPKDRFRSGEAMAVDFHARVAER
jgi:serine/threonine protein kinase